MDLLKEITKTIDPRDVVGFDRDNFQSLDGDDIEEIARNMEVMVKGFMGKFSKHLLSYAINVGECYYDAQGNEYSSDEVLEIFLKIESKKED